MTIEEFEQWYASRKEVARSIDIETAEIARWAAYDADPYGILEAKGELPESMQQIGKSSWVRTPQHPRMGLRGRSIAGTVQSDVRPARARQPKRTVVR
jgi:hypothetical protein